MAQWLLFHRTWVQFLAPAVLLTTICNSNSRESSLLASLDTTCTHAQTYMLANTDTHKIEINKSLNVYDSMRFIKCLHLRAHQCTLGAISVTPGRSLEPNSLFSFCCILCGLQCVEFHHLVFTLSSLVIRLLRYFRIYDVPQ